MYHDTMIQTNNNCASKFIQLGKKLGLNKKDLEGMLKTVPMRDEQLLLSIGPPGYGGGGYYGTISINDFENQSF